MLVATFLVFSASAPLWALPQKDVVQARGFGYKRTGHDECSVCFPDDDCFVLQPVRCEFYMETTNILQPQFQTQEPPKIRMPSKFKADTDALMFSLIENGLNERVHEECIPFVSKYTDCNKENVCLGCKTCDCNWLGQWNCTVTQKCRPDLLDIVADHETLRTIILNQVSDDTPNVRRKRSLHKWYMEKSWEDAHENEEMSHAKLAEWINEEPTLDFQAQKEKRTNEDEYYEKPERHLEPTKSMNPHKKEKFVKTIVNSLIRDALPEIFRETRHDFENNRVKRWIRTKSKNNSKPTLVTSNKKYENLTNTQNMTEPPKGAIESVTKITFDELYEWMNIVHPKVYIDNATEMRTNQLKQLESWKMAVNAVPITTEPQTNPDYLAFEEVLGNIVSDNKTYTRRKSLSPNKHIDEFINMDDSKYYLEEERINSNERDVEEKPFDVDEAYNLFRGTSGNLRDLDSAKRMTYNETDNMDMLNNKIDNVDGSISNIMKREIPTLNEDIGTNPNNSFDLSGPGSLQSLKEDILKPLDKILRDKQNEIEELTKIKENLISFLKTHKDSKKNMSQDSVLSFYKLEILPHHHHSKDSRRTNATLLSKYLLKLKRDIYEVIRDIIGIRKQYSDPTKVPQEIIYLIKSLKHYIHKTGFRVKKEKVKILRRKNEETSFIKNIMIKILELLDTSMPKSDVLGLVSQDAARVIKRFLKNNYIDKFAGSGLRMYDPHYNLTDDLKNVGTQWLILTSMVQNSPIHDKLYNMKRLHLSLSLDIAKMNDALALIEFARSRRMVPVNELDGERIVDNINKNLDQTMKNFVDIVSPRTLEITNEVQSVNNEQQKKKVTFLSQIKKLIQTSRKDILKLFKKKVPKTEIVKELARKHVEEMTRRKLEDTMQKWQTNLNIVSNNREKRSSGGFNEISRRIKNIIPKYLRGKVHPAITKNKKTKKSKGNATGSRISLRKKTTTATSTKFRQTTTPTLKKISSTVSAKTANKTTKLQTTKLTTITSKTTITELPSAGKTTIKS